MHGENSNTWWDNKILDRAIRNRTIKLLPQTGKKYTKQEDALALCIEHSSPPHQDTLYIAINSAILAAGNRSVGSPTSFMCVLSMCTLPR